MACVGTYTNTVIILIFLVVIVDPGIKVDHGYRSYDNGMDLGVFIRVCILTGATYVHKISPQWYKNVKGNNIA